MRILAASDIHGAVAMLKYVLRREHADILVLAGDLSNNSLHEARNVLRVAKNYDLNVVFVPGNMDPPALLDMESFEGAINLHGKVKNILGLSFGGLGGGGISPFNTPIEFDENTFWQKLSSLNDIDVLVSHAPPYKTRLDIVRPGMHVGSKSLLKFLEERQPILCICGHIHEAYGTDFIRRTALVNPGPLMWGRYAVIEIHDRSVRLTLKNLNS